MKDQRVPLRHILDAIGRIELYTAPGREAFDADSMRRDAIARNLEVIGEAVNRLPEDVRRPVPDFSWREPIGMRNWLIHGYDAIDMDIVWETVTRDIPRLQGCRRRPS
jgi:uncharacterized protein with HEPN domain